MTSIDVFGGFSLAQAYDPLSQNMNSVHGKLFAMLATMLLFTSNAHLLVIGGLLRSFEPDAGRAPPWQPAGRRRGGHAPRSGCSSPPRCRSRCR